MGFIYVNGANVNDVYANVNICEIHYHVCQTHCFHMRKLVHSTILDVFGLEVMYLVSEHRFPRSLYVYDHLKTSL